MTTTVAIRSRIGSPTVWLEVTYQGLAPPTELFADLVLVGWAPPAVAPPPHDAIDWSQSNEATGERFTLRDYTVPRAVVQPPTGGGARGAWTDAERHVHLAALGRVLDRHPDLVVDDPAALVRGVDLLPPAPPPPATSTAAVLPPPPPAPAPAFTPSVDATAILVTAPLKPSLAPRVEDALVELGVTVVFDSQERVRTERYRGSSYETTVTELHVAAVAAPDQLPAVTAVLAGYGLPLTFAEVDDAAVGAAPPDASDPVRSEQATADPAAAVTMGRDGLARVVVLADQRFGDAVGEVFRALGLAHATATPGTRLEVSRYRGSRSEREVPTLRVEARVPEPHARLVATHLAEAAHLRPDDADRCWIEPPGPPDPSSSTAPPNPGSTSTAAEAAAADAALPPPQAPSPSTAPLPVPGVAATRLDPSALARRPLAAAVVDHGR